MKRRRFLRAAALLVLTPVLACAEPPADLVDVQSVIPRIRVELVYATERNFVGVAMYKVKTAYLRRPVADALSKVQADLERQGLGLKVWDAYRPLSVQKRFWELVPDERYVASPVKGSRHNRGAAVDVTLVNDKGEELEMPTKFDDFTPRAGAFDPEHTAAAIANRKKLQDAMLAHGFTILPTEWWHFDGPDWQKYEVLDVPLESVGAGGSR